MTNEWKSISEEVREAGVQGAGGETVCAQSLEGGRKGGWAGKFGWGRKVKEFVPDGLDFSQRRAL